MGYAGGGAREGEEVLRNGGAAGEGGRKPGYSGGGEGGSWSMPEERALRTGWEMQDVAEGKGKGNVTRAKDIQREKRGKNGKEHSEKKE